jgi:PHP family Zn ribbon phosphoesterase
MRQLQKLQGQSTPADTVKAAVANAGQVPHQSYNKTCTKCNNHFLVDKAFKAKHSMCFDCFKVTDEGVAKYAAKYAARDEAKQAVQARKNNQDNSNIVKVQAVHMAG